MHRNGRCARKIASALGLAALVYLSTAPALASKPSHYLIGRGSADITGPLVGVPLWGFGRPDQVGEGLHIRLRSRAFVIVQASDPERRLVFASVDLGSVDHHMALEVVERLQRRFGATYNLDNVIISATHTHAGPGGYWQSRTETGLDGGLYPQHFDAIAAGITASIEKAHDDLQIGDILINSGRVSDAGANRSLVAYLENPAQERARYADNTNTEMVLLKFRDDTGDIGMLNWFALHPTAMNYYNVLVSGDHKGYASLITERAFGATYETSGEFVAAFAQSDPGDVTPNTNLDNTGPGATDVETTRIMGERQLQAARRLFDGAQERLAGSVDSRRVYVDLSDFEVQGRFTGSGTRRTCPSAYGYSFAGGSTEDGGAHFLFREGMIEQQAWRDWLIRFVTGAPRWTESVRACQAPKPILFETGSGSPPLQSQVHSVTLARIGQLVIIALPAEVTTMAGRRLRESVRREFGDAAGHVVIAGYANGYAGYVTTPEEYMLQQYEAGHTLHGRWTLPAYQQVFSQLARAMVNGAAPGAQAAFDDWRVKSKGKPLPMDDSDGTSAGAQCAAAWPLDKARYSGGERVAVDFWSVNPTAYFPRGERFLQVEFNTAQGWQTVADDADWSTRVRWRVERGARVARGSWEIPDDAAAGEYRLRHFCYTDAEQPISDVSDVFRVNH